MNGEEQLILAPVGILICIGIGGLVGVLCARIDERTDRRKGSKTSTKNKEAK